MPDRDKVWGKLYPPRRKCDRCKKTVIRFSQANKLWYCDHCKKTWTAREIGARRPITNRVEYERTARDNH